MSIETFWMQDFDMRSSKLHVTEVVNYDTPPPQHPCRMNTPDQVPLRLGNSQWQKAY